MPSVAEPANLQALSENLARLQRSSRKTLPVFLLGVLATLVAAAVALYYIISLSADLRQAREALAESQAALNTAQENLASLSALLQQAQSQAGARNAASAIEDAISQAKRSEANIQNAAHSISAAEEKLTPSGNTGGSNGPPAPPLPKPAGAGRFVVADTADGFLSLREQATRSSAEVARIASGTVLQCESAELNASGFYWRRCADPRGRTGFVSNNYLREQ